LGGAKREPQEVSDGKLMTAADVKILQGRYKLLETIGRGGIGVVNKAEHISLERFVAVKKFHTLHLLSLSAFKKRWVETTKISHSNIIVLHDLFEEEGETYLVMEYMPDGSLRDKIDVKGQLSVDESVKIAIQVLKGLEVLHNQKIYHRDLKPENILFSGDQVKLTDFDIAHLPDYRFTRIGFQPGSLYYMAPEQVRGEEPTPAMDIYALGAIFYEMVTGEHYLDFNKRSLSQEEKKRIIQMESPVSIKERRRDVSDKLEKIILKSLNKSPQKRYSSTIQMLSDLERIPDVKISYPEPSFPPERRGKKKFFKFAPVFLMFIVLIIIEGLLWWFLYRDSFQDHMGSFVEKANQYILLAYDPTDFVPDEKDSPETSIEKDIQTLWQSGFQGITTFCAKGSLGRIPEIAKKNGMKFVIMGIWNLKDEEEVKTAKGAVNYVVDGYCVGHNGLGERYTFLDLKKVISSLRSDTHKPITTTERLADYGSHPDLLEIGDWFFPDAHGYWHEGATPEEIVNGTVEAIKKASNLVGTYKKPIILKMVSFPSGPERVSSEAAQAQFFQKLFLGIRNRTDIPKKVKLSYLGAFDIVWKEPKKGWPAGEMYTGLFTQSRRPKQAVEVFQVEMRRGRQ
jgi:serine/threonine protein kinase